MPQQVAPTPKNADGLKWVSPKADRLQLTTGALSTRYIIHEVHEEPARQPRIRSPKTLCPHRCPPRAGTRRTTPTTIPPFNPFKLYANCATGQYSNDDADDNAGSGLSRTDVSVKVVELLGGILPGEDGQELDTQEVQEIVEHNADVVAGGQKPARRHRRTARRRQPRQRPCRR